MKAGGWRTFLVGLLMAGVVLAQVASANSFDVGEKLDDLPDVHQPLGEPVCGQVAAAILLGAAGWGSGDGIFNQIHSEFGCTSMFVHDAINWWTREHGCSGASPYYSVKTYNYLKNDGGTNTQYEFLLDELERCQYVNVDWYWDWNATKKKWDGVHALALGAGDHWDSTDSESAWRDGNTHDTPTDITGNNFDGASKTWHIKDPNDPDFTVPARAIAGLATTLCPGKPAWATKHYDLSWDGLTLTEAGYMAKTYDSYWEDAYKLLVGNASWRMVKQLFLELSFKEAQDPATYDLESLVTLGTDSPDRDIQLHGGWHWYDGNKTALAKFTIDPQPSSEYILFDIYLLDEDLAGFNVATYCVPEPATMLLLGLGTFAMFLRHRRRRAACRR